MRSLQIEVGDSVLHALEWKGGPALLVCFPGFSNDASLWRPMAALLLETHTVVSIDLPHHGRSKWKPGEILDRKAFANAIRKLMLAYDVGTIDLLGFSLGARICMCIIQDLGSIVNRVVFAAPDGLRFNVVFYFLTGTVPGKSIFRHFINKPAGYVRFFDFVHRRGWIDAARHRFMLHHTASDQARIFLGGAWPSLQHMVPDLQKVKRIMIANNRPVHLFMGRHDPVIPLRYGEGFAKRTGPVVHLHIMDRGHNILDAEVLRKMAQAVTEGS